MDDLLYPVMDADDDTDFDAETSLYDEE